MNIVQKKERGRPRKGQTDRAADRQALIDAAVAILDAGGAAALTARSVAERAGTAVGSVYTQFESLELLRLEANAVTMHRLRDTLAAALAACPAGGTEDRLLCLADAYLAFAAANHAAWAAVFERRTVAAPEAVQADIAALFGILEDVLRDGGRLAEAEIPVMARALWSSVHGMAYLADLGSLGPIAMDDVRPMIDALVRAAVRGFSGG
ncbi:TetR/AcrR family transcriptional regulator [Methylobacterium sp. A49B]|uniref:TetR/AcrR family transcriptional regulator n=1 Tax=Methylobacterium mesophilicum SR1.6/6 TaxID=908290 RepID=A0A6B9FCS0_9HYPH|nr:TetR/AcrR family transcriptional regulator [Methylobacterium mesophilicum]QGY01171.1 TetR/AcrR family transcriptional regulator [Methylobacterium mesophilicum SR1.6/6]